MRKIFVLATLALLVSAPAYAACELGCDTNYTNGIKDGTGTKGITPEPCPGCEPRGQSPGSGNDRERGHAGQWGN